jgi:hypothetical protein
MIMQTSEVKFLAYVNSSSINSRSIINVVINYTVYTGIHNCVRGAYTASMVYMCFMVAICGTCYVL